ncbi:MAG TPA: class F sortase, partial [Acidimicrobiales bacterium]|nr:class F sortase [Acidimicrobiales bacterium]
PKESTRRLTRRLVAAVPAATGIALLGAGIADLAGRHAQHALTVDLQRPAGNPSSASTPPSSVFVAPSSLPPQAAALPVPLSVSVPRLHSRASVAGEVHVQTSGPEIGLLDAPSDYHQLGWYRNGDPGALVLDGHVGFRTDPGPLAFIGSLGQGDVVTANFASGQRNFAVSVVGRAVKGQLPQQYFSHQYDGDLMLITCDYTSPFRAGHFADNVYVVAVPAQ